MTVGSKLSLPVASSFDNILNRSQFLRCRSPASRLRIWKEDGDENEDENGVPILKLSHPILRTLESSNPASPNFNQIQSQLLISGLFQHPLAAGRFIKKLCNSPTYLPHAVYIFSHLEEPDAFICNTILRSYLNSNNLETAFKFYHLQVLQKCVSPNHFTFPLLTKMFAKMGLIKEGEKAHALIIKYGFQLDQYVQNSLITMYFSFGKVAPASEVFDGMLDMDLVTWNSMIDGYAKNGLVAVARGLFDEMDERDIVSWNAMLAGYVGVEDIEAAEELFVAMPVRDVVSWNSMLDGYAKVGNVLAAREVFERVPGRNVVSWNTMLALYVRTKDYNGCLKLFDKMMSDGDVKPDAASLVSVLSACANLGSLDRGKCIHSYMKNNDWIETDVLLSTTLLTMYAKCGDVDLAREVFDEMPHKEVVSWNSMIMGYAMHGQSEKSLQLFLEMEKKGPRPNEVTFICVLSACAHGGMVLEGWWYFDMMTRVYKIKPKVEHYGCMVDLLGRAGLLKDSAELIKKMPIKPAPALWGALLSACRTHSNRELGERVGKRLMELDPTDIGPYMLLSDIYASEGRWDDVENVREMTREKGLEKTAGLSWVDLAGSDFEAFVEGRLEHRKSVI